MTLLLATLISWTVVSNTPSASEVRTDGRLVSACAPVSVTVKGVPFAGAPSVSEFPHGVAFPVPMRRVTGVYWDDPDGRWNGDADYRTLLSNGFYASDIGARRLTVTLDGLEAGRRYLVQFWFNDMRPSRRNSCQFVGGQALTMSEGGCPFGACATGTFVASGPTRRFTVGNNVEGQVNALQVRLLDGTVATRSVSLPAPERSDHFLAQFNPVWTNGDLGVSADSVLPTAALLGNGSLGAVNGGAGNRKTFILTRGDLWSCGALRNGKGHDPSREILPISFADFEIDAGDGRTAYEDTLDVATATLRTRGTIGGTEVSLETYVAAETDALVVSGLVSRDAVWKLRLRVHDDLEEFPAEAFVLDDGAGVRRRTIDATRGDPRGWTTNATAVVRAVGAEVFRTCAPSSLEAVADVRLTAGRPFSFVILPSCGGRADEAAVRCLRKGHEAWWRNWWDRSRISIGDVELERFYYGSLYLLGSCCRSGKFPSGLYGLWVTTDGPKWHNDFHLNYNYIATYYGCYAANRPEIADTLPDPLIAYLPRAELNARTRLGELDRRIRNDTPDRIDYVQGRADLRGGIADAALFPVGLGPWGVSSEGDDQFWNQTLNGPFQTAAVCTYWEYTLDRAYLKKVWPLLDRVANFYLKWCEKEELPSGCHRYVLWDSMGEGFGLRKNCALTIGTVRYLFETLVSAAPVLRELGCSVPDDKVAAWRDHARNLAPLPVGLSKVGERDVLTLSNLEPVNGRAVLGAGGGFELESVIPGEAFAFDVTEEMKAAATNTVAAKLAYGEEAVWGGINQTPKLYATAVRVGYPAASIIAVFKKFELARRSQRNFTLRDGYHGMEKAGAIEFVNSMLIQSDHGYVKVFPNWTGADASFENLRAKGAFAVSAEMKGGRVTRVAVKSEKGGVFRLVDPFAGTCVAPGWTKGTTRWSREVTLERELRPGEVRVLTGKGNDR